MTFDKWHTFDTLSVMTTTKKRMNISLSDSAYEMIVGLAQRDQVPEATKASSLIELALEVEEDYILSSIARARDVKGVKWIPDSDAIWK